MRIGFDGRWYGNSGVGNYVSGLLQALSGLNGDLEIILYENPESPLTHISGSNIHKTPVSARKYSVQEQIELPRRCRIDRLDVFHTPFYVTPLLAPCPVVVTIHDLIPFMFNIYGRPHQMLVRAGYRLAVLKAAQLIAVSQKTADDLQRILSVSNGKVSVIHHGVRRDVFSDRRSPGEDQYLFATRSIRAPYVMAFSAKNWKTKNLATALEALSICQQRTGIGFQTVIVGFPDALSEVLNSAAARNLDIVTTGFVAKEELPKLYRNASVFLLPSRYEGFGLPLLEAMACGCAAVCSRGGSLPEIAGDGAVLVDPENPVEMADAVSQLLSDPQHHQRQSEKALRRAELFSWEKAARQTVSVYSEAIEER